MANYEYFAREDILNVAITKHVELWIEVYKLCKRYLVCVTYNHQVVVGFDLIKYGNKFLLVCHDLL